MLPLIEDYIRSCVTSKLQWIKNNPDQIPVIFGTLGRRSSLKNFQQYVKATDFKVLLGYPREANQLPAFVLTLAGENEVTAGIGDCIDEDFEDDEHQYCVDTVYMDANFRLEVWTDNADLAVYMYTLGKWALLTSRKDMLCNGFVLPRVSGADLEPVPDYFPIFVYRRALMLNFQYENEFYFEELDADYWRRTNIIPHSYPPGDIIL